MSRILLSLQASVVATVGFLLMVATVAFGVELPAPRLLAPPDGATFTLVEVNQGRVTLDWSDVSGAVEYEVDLKGPSGFLSSLEPVVPSRVLFPQTTLDGRYVWRVRAYDVSATPGIFSATRSLHLIGRVDPTPTPSPTPHPFVAIYDLNRNGIVEAGDLVMLLRYMDRNDPQGDFDQSGHTDWADLLLFTRGWGLR